MTNYIRGDLLLYTNKGIKRIDKLNKSDFLDLVDCPLSREEYEKKVL